MKKLLIGLTLLSTMTSFSSETIDLNPNALSQRAELGQEFEIIGTEQFRYDSSCANCGSKKDVKTRAKLSAKDEVIRICNEVNAVSASISDYDLIVKYDNGYLLNVGAPRRYRAIATANCNF